MEISISLFFLISTNIKSRYYAYIKQTIGDTEKWRGLIQLRNPRMNSFRQEMKAPNLETMAEKQSPEKAGKGTVKG